MAVWGCLVGSVTLAHETIRPAGAPRPACGLGTQFEVVLAGEPSTSHRRCRRAQQGSTATCPGRTARARLPPPTSGPRARARGALAIPRCCRSATSTATSTSCGPLGTTFTRPVGPTVVHGQVGPSFGRARAATQQRTAYPAAPAGRIGRPATPAAPRREPATTPPRAADRLTIIVPESPPPAVPSEPPTLSSYRNSTDRIFC